MKPSWDILPAIELVPLTPQGTNSTFFTECCTVAICDDERNCPRCKKPVIGYSAQTNHERRLARWENATRFWKK